MEKRNSTIDRYGDIDYCVNLYGCTLVNNLIYYYKLCEGNQKEQPSNNEIEARVKFNIFLYYIFLLIF